MQLLFSQITINNKQNQNTLNNMKKNLFTLSAIIFVFATVTAQNLRNDNTAVGTDALTSFTSGAKNVAFGNKTLRATTTGEGNSAFGLETLKANTIGSYNTAIGGLSLISATAAKENTAIGYKSMTNATGIRNTAVGFRSLSKVLGEENVAFGYQSGESLTNGTRNIMIGSGAGSNSNGSYNIIFGYGSGSSSIGDNNIIIGKKATLPNGAANAMNIGGVLYASGLKSNTTLTSVSASGRIGINVVAPTATLDVVGNAKISAGLSVNGNVGIGTTNNPQYKLDVAGTIRAKEIKVELNVGADFVFEPDYKLRNLSEVEAFINANKHLPEIESEKEMQENGLNITEFQIKLLQKVEELTLYAIQQEKRLEEQEKLIRQLQEKVK